MVHGFFFFDFLWILPRRSRVFRLLIILGIVIKLLIKFNSVIIIPRTAKISAKSKAFEYVRYMILVALKAIKSKTGPLRLGDKTLWLVIFPHSLLVQASEWKQQYLTSIINIIHTFFQHYLITHLMELVRLQTPQVEIARW